MASNFISHTHRTYRLPTSWMTPYLIYQQLSPRAHNLLTRSGAVGIRLRFRPPPLVHPTAAWRASVASGCLLPYRGLPHDSFTASAATATMTYSWHWTITDYTLAHWHTESFTMKLDFALLIHYIFALLCIHGSAYTRKLSKRVVQTKFGKLRGLLIDMPKSNLAPVEAYLGLQYASVLGRELRFLPPTGPMEEWSGVRVAITHRSVCPQNLPDLAKLNQTVPRGRYQHIQRILPFLQEQSEECLNLNLYVPTRGKLHFVLFHRCVFFVFFQVIGL